MSSKPAPSPEIFRSQEAAFIEHYGWLMKWALQFTNHNRAHAEDLVQEVFAQLAFRHTNLAEVQNIPGYLYTTLRNIHISEIRIAGRSHIQSPSVVEYNLADTALSASNNPHDLYQTQDHLRRICYYACVRKQSSRAGSVMILRFFFGYHLSEVAQILGGTCQAVRQCLRSARNEAQAFLDDPDALAFIDRAQTLKTISPTTVCGTEELLADLRLAIFRSRQGECLDSDLVNEFYHHGLIETTTNSTLAHIVSCRRCLDAANGALNLPLLAERHPADALGPDNSSRGGPRASGGSGGAKHDLRSRRRNQKGEEDITSSFLLRCRRRARELFEHHPRELCVSVNGYVLGSQSVSSEISRLRLDITIPEPLSFIEVMSEENARLLVMAIDAPPSGEPTQTRHVALSEGREIEVTLRYGHPWPMLEVVYQDPSFTAESLVSVSQAGGAWELKPAEDSSTVAAQIEPGACMDQTQANRLKRTNSLQRLTETCKALTGVIRRSKHRNLTRGPLFNFSRGINLIRPVWSRPSFVTAILSLFLIGALLFVRLNITPAVSAANLIERATAAEQALNGVTDRAVRRVINLEERAHAGGELMARSRIEIWRDSRRGLSVRRVYDEKGRLVAGEWVTNHSQPEGIASRTIYRRGERPRIEPSVRSTQAALHNLELWQLEPSAKEFAELIGGAGAARVSEDSHVYVVSYANGEATANGTPLQATLTLRKSNLHPIEQTLILPFGSGTRECRLIEASFEQPPVAPEAFVVDRELLAEALNGESGNIKRENNSRPTASVVPTSPVVATADLEVELAYVLDKFRTRFGDQINLTRTPEGLLRIDGVVDTDQSKQEILGALSPVINNPAVTIQISTVTEALARQQQRSTAPPIIREFSGWESAIPAYTELRYYFSRAGDAKESSAKDDRIEQDVRSFAARVVGQSRRVLSHAIELRQLKQRFSEAQLNVLTPNPRAKWFGMVRNHAEIVGRETSLLDQELRAIFSPGVNRPEIAGIEITNYADLATAIERLYKLTVTNDEVIRSAFTASSEPSAAMIVKGQRFYVSLAMAEKIAEKIRQAATSLGERE